MGKSYQKTSLKFDEEKRKDFLTGFHKRKEARKKHARQQMDKQLREKRSAIRQGKQKEISKRLEEINQIKMENGNTDGVLLENECVDPTVIDLPNHQVTVVETSMFNPLENLFVGSNETDEEKPEANPEEIKKTTKTVEKLAKKKQMLTSKKHKKSTQQKANKKMKKFLRKARSQKGRNK
uniref:Nucleolar protein 12 n=1 Tax=Phallusia mammillata TaxID=59560 RepID=A0A6F9DLS4_9ASCI|nr:nucleolar protein 12-like [Phallusia mammillata]